MEKLSDIGEDALIERFTRDVFRGPDVVVGAGDDCAVLECDALKIWRLLKVDSVVEGIHFSSELESEIAGRKAVNRTLSDFAAMGGGTAKAALVNFAAPPEYATARAEGFYRGIRKVLEKHRISLIGGETVSLATGSAAMISVFMSGEIDRCHGRFRFHANVGDWIAVTGRLGGSLDSGHHHAFSPRIDADA